MFQLNVNYILSRGSCSTIVPALSFRRSRLSSHCRRNRRNRTDHISRIRLHFRTAGIVARKWRTHSSHLLPRVRSTIAGLRLQLQLSRIQRHHIVRIRGARCRGHCQFPWQITFQYHVPFLPPPSGEADGACRPLRTPARIVRG